MLQQLMNFDKIISPYSLRNSWVQIKHSKSKKNLGNCELIKSNWFVSASKLLLKGKMKYINQTHFKTWFYYQSPAHVRRELVKKVLIDKIWFVRENNQNMCKKFEEQSFNEQRYGLLHQFLKTIIGWRANLTWFLSYKVKSIFKKLNEKRFKNLFLTYIKEPWIWKELSKLVEISSKREQKMLFNSLGSEQKDILESFILDICLNELDSFVRVLKKKLNHTLKYARFKDYFVIGVSCSKHTANNICQKIGQLIKSNLHLRIEKADFCNLKSRHIELFGFKIILARDHKQFWVKQNHLLLNMMKYQKHITDRVSQSNARLSKALIFNFKKSLLKNLHDVLFWRRRVFNKLNSALIVKKLTQKSSNLMLKRWARHFHRLSNKEILLCLKFFYNWVNNSTFKKRKPYYLRIFEIQNHFLTNIKEIQNKLKLQLLHNKRGIMLQKQATSQAAFIIEKILGDVKIKKKLLLIASTSNLIKMLIKKGFYHSKYKKPTVKISFSTLEDIQIIRQYSTIIKSLLNYYSISDNFSRIRILVKSLWHSCYLTLAFKHKKSIQRTYKIFTCQMWALFNREIADISFWDIKVMTNTKNDKRKNISILLLLIRNNQLFRKVGGTLIVWKNKCFKVDPALFSQFIKNIAKL